MKKIVVAIMVLSMMFAAMAAMAQGEKNFSITPRIAANFAIDKDSLDNKQANQFGVLVDLNWSNLPVGLEVGYMQGSKKHTEDIWVNDDVLFHGDVKVKSSDIPVMITYDYDFNDNFYATVGAGVAIKTTRLTADGDEWDFYDWDVEKVYDSEKQTKTHFAFQLGLGYKFAQNWSVEAIYWNQGKTRFDKKASKGEDYYDYKGSYFQVNVGYTF